MTVSEYPAAVGYALWLASSSSQADLDAGLKLGYIEWKGVRLNITRKEPWQSEGPGLITMLVHVEAGEKEREEINATSVAEIKHALDS